MSTLSRRQLLKLAAAGAAGAVAVPVLHPFRRSGGRRQAGRQRANRASAPSASAAGPRCCSINCPRMPKSSPCATAICRGPKRSGQAERPPGRCIQDYRKLLERKDIDAVIVGTGEFQRVLPCIHACQAGKDIYAEKPLTLYIGEGRVLVDAVRRHDRVFQVGTQQRSMAMNRIACELVRSGGLGKVLEVRAVTIRHARIRPPNAVSAKRRRPPGWIGTCG